MGGCTSTPQAVEGQVETNSSPVHAEATQVKEKLIASVDPQRADAPDTAAQSTASATAQQPREEEAQQTQPPVKAEDAQVEGVKAVEESKESGPQEGRPSTASQPKSARNVTASTPRTPRTATTATQEVVIPAGSTPSSSDVFAISSTSSSSSSSPSSQFDVADEEFRRTVKSVLVLLLDRLTRTMEYEKAAFQELAVGVGHGNYMQLIDYEAFEAFLRAHFTIPPSPAPHRQDDDLRYLSQYFVLFLNLASSAPSTTSGARRTFPSRVSMTESLQRLCAQTSEQLLKWKLSPHATYEVKEHLDFFSAALQFTRGDLVQHPELLYKNIDEICD